MEQMDISGLTIPEIIELVRRLMDELELREMEQAGEQSKGGRLT